MTESEAQLIAAITFDNSLLAFATLPPEAFTFDGAQCLKLVTERIREGGITPQQLIDMAARGAFPQEHLEKIVLRDNLFFDQSSVESAQLEIRDAFLQQEMRRIASVQGSTPSETLDRRVNELALLTRHTQGLSAVPMGHAVECYYQALSDDTQKPPVRSGLRLLDELLNGGFWPGEYILLAARPSMGKSTCARQFATRAALDGKRVVFFSAEDTQETFIARALSSASGVPLQNIRNRDMDDYQWMEVGNAVGKLKNLPLHIVNGKMRPKDIEATVARAGNVDLIVVDYIGMVTDRGENRGAAIGEASGLLKEMAKELNCPAIVLSQLNRALEQRPNKRPVSSDLRDSGELEQDADVLIFLYRDEVYDPQSRDAGMMELIVTKQRNGAIGAVKLPFDKERGVIGGRTTPKNT